LQREEKESSMNDVTYCKEKIIQVHLHMLRKFDHAVTMRKQIPVAWYLLFLQLCYATWVSMKLVVYATFKKKKKNLDVDHGLVK
jgi:hypothetical protein